MPRRDLWLLPLIVLLTALAMMVCAEGAARIFWPEQTRDSCQVTDGAQGIHYRPHCVSVMKAAEGPWYENRYNACGYRSSAGCGTPPPGTRRVALIGSSISQGYMVPYDDTIANRLAVGLGAACHAPVEVQNLGAPGAFGPRLIGRMEAALRLHPDQVVLVMLPFDLEGLAAPGEAAQTTHDAPPGGGLHQVFEHLKLSRAVLVAQHFLFRNRSVYLPLYLRYGDKADFLRVPFSKAWRDRLATLDTLLGDLTMRAQRAGVPFLVAFVPQEAQLTLLAEHAALPRISPDALPAAIGGVAERLGVSFIDASARLVREASPERLYYQVDGHLAGPGQRLVGSSIADALAGVRHGPFAGCAAPDDRTEALR